MLLMLTEGICRRILVEVENFISKIIYTIFTSFLKNSLITTDDLECMSYHNHLYKKVTFWDKLQFTVWHLTDFRVAISILHCLYNTDYTDFPLHALCNSWKNCLSTASQSAPSVD